MNLSICAVCAAVNIETSTGTRSALRRCSTICSEKRRHCWSNRCAANGPTAS